MIIRKNIIKNLLFWFAPTWDLARKKPPKNKIMLVKENTRKKILAYSMTMICSNMSFFMRQKSWHTKREICGMRSHKRGEAVPLFSSCLPHHVKHSLSTVGAHLSENLKWPCGFYQRSCFKFSRNEEALKLKMMLGVQSITENKNLSAEALR